MKNEGEDAADGHADGEAADQHPPAEGRNLETGHHVRVARSREDVTFDVRRRILRRTAAPQLRYLGAAAAGHRIRFGGRRTRRRRRSIAAGGGNGASLRVENVGGVRRARPPVVG